MFKTIAVVAGRLALPESEDVGEAKAEGHECDEEGGQQRRFNHHQQDEEHSDGHADTAHEPPEQAAFQTPGATFGIGRGVGIGETEFGFHARGRSGVGYWVKASPCQNVPTPTALLVLRPKMV